MVKSQAEKEELFFVEVTDSSNVKRNILESLKDIVQSLQRFEKFKELRAQKTDNIAHLRKDLREISKMVSDLRVMFPEAKLREAKLKPVLRQGTRKKSTAKKQSRREGFEQERPASELQRLESELGMIEEKLKGLQ